MRRKIGNVMLVVGIFCIGLYVSAHLVGCKTLLDPMYPPPVEEQAGEPPPTQASTQERPPLRIEYYTSEANKVVEALKPAASVADPATGGVPSLILLGVSNLLTLVGGVAAEYRKRKLEYALNEIHRESANGAPSLASDVKAKAIIADVTGI